MKLLFEIQNTHMWGFSIGVQQFSLGVEIYLCFWKWMLVLNFVKKVAHNKKPL